MNIRTCTPINGSIFSNTSSYPAILIKCMGDSRVLARIFAIGGTLCIINDLGGLVNNGCGKLHVRELQVAMQRSKTKQKLVKGQQLTLFGERASSDTDNLSKS